MECGFLEEAFKISVKLKEMKMCTHVEIKQTEVIL
jgi:hypothetical protein